MRPYVQVGIDPIAMAEVLDIADFPELGHKADKLPSVHYRAGARLEVGFVDGPNGPLVGTISRWLPKRKQYLFVDDEFLTVLCDGIRTG